MNESTDKNTQPGDKDLHDEVVSRLYQQLPDESPAADTDAVIRAAARREVGAGPQRRLVRLQKLLATAASLVLGVALVVQWQHREPEKLAEVLATAPIQASLDTDAAAPAPAPALEESAPAAKPAAPARNMAVQAPGEKAEKAYASGALAGAGAPVQSLAPAPAFAPQDMAPENRAAENAESLKKSRREEEQLAADMAASRERRLSTARESTARESAAAAAPAASIAALRQESLQAKADMADAKAAAGLPATAPYRNAMRQQQWPQALAELEKLAFATDSSLLVDHDILQRLAGRKDLPACSRLGAAELGAQSGLCALLQNLAQGKSLPADAFAQLEKAGLLSGIYDYRRPALLQLLQP